MPRHVEVATAQMGPSNEAARREEIGQRMLGLLDDAIRGGGELIQPESRR